MKTHATLFVTLTSFLVSTASTAFAAPPAAKVENVHSVTDGQRTIRIIAAPIRAPSGKPSLAERVLGRRPVPMEGGVAQALPAADQPDPDADDEFPPVGPAARGADDAPGAGEGGVAATTVGGQIQVLGMELRYGPTGPVVPIRLDSKLQSDPDFVPRFGGADLKVYNAENPPNCSENTPSTCDGIETVALGGSTGLLVFRARAAFDPDNADHDNNPWTGADFHREVPSDSANSLVLIDGDNINDLITQRGIQAPYGGQVPIKDILAIYIDSAGNVYLDPNRILILFELGTTNTSSAAYDFQDLVIALDLNGIVAAPDYVFPNETAIGSPYSDVPQTEFLWSMVRAAPGGSRIKGLAYSRVLLDANYDGYEFIRACIAGAGTNPSWTTCTFGTAYSFPVNSPEFFGTVDMAMNDNGFHGFGGQLNTLGGSLTRYIVSFTKDNGVTWDTSERQIGRYTGTSGVDDIDLASNEAGSIGVLVYYKVTASPTDMYGAVTDSLVLYTYNKNVDPTLNNPVKTVIVAGSGVQFASLCKGACFTLTGDGGDTFQAFYYQGGAAKVSTITGASTAPSTTVRTITNNSAVTQIGAGSTCQAPSTTAGAAVVITSGTGIGVYDVPVSGTITLRTTTAFNPFLDDSVYTTALTRTSTPVGGPAVTLYRMSSSGQQSNAAVSDSLPYPYCGTAPTPPPNGYGTPCALYKGNDTPPLSYGATVIGNVHYSSSFRQDQAWTDVSPAGPTNDQYLATIEHIIIHQTSAEP